MLRYEQWTTVKQTIAVIENPPLFCTSRPQYFRAFWTPSLASMEPSIEIGYSAIQCTSTDKLATRNLWECNHQLGDGLCKGSHEAAGVTCDAVPATKQIGK